MSAGYRPRPAPTSVPKDYSSDTPQGGGLGVVGFVVIFSILTAIFVGAIVAGVASDGPPRICAEVEYKYKERYRGGPIDLQQVCKRWAP